MRRRLGERKLGPYARVRDDFPDLAEFCDLRLLEVPKSLETQEVRGSEDLLRLSFFGELRPPGV